MVEGNVKKRMQQERNPNPKTKQEKERQIQEKGKQRLEKGSSILYSTFINYMQEN